MLQEINVVFCYEDYVIFKCDKSMFIIGEIKFKVKYFYCKIRLIYFLKNKFMFNIKKYK